VDPASAAGPWVPPVQCHQMGPCAAKTKVNTEFTYLCRLYINCVPMCHHASMITFVLILCDLIFLSGSNFL